MDDALELDVDDNEFASESLHKETQKSAKNGSDVKSSKLSPSFNPNDYISLSEAKTKLLRSLGEHELQDDVMSCSRGSVKSRLGVREPGHEIEFMECSDTNDVFDGGDAGGGRSSDSSQSKNVSARVDSEQDAIPRRPSMKNLCKRLRVKWYDNPVKVGKELAERLEEHKFALIINVVKTIGGKNAIALFNETKRIQLEGGMKTCNGSRRRTSGGVFLTLLKSSDYATEEQIKEIFKDDSKLKTEASKRRKALYQQRRKAKKLLEQQQAATLTASAIQAGDNTVQAGNNTVQAGNNTVQAGDNTVQAGDNTVQAGNNTVQAGDDTVQAGNNTVQAGDNTVEVQAGDNSVQSENNIMPTDSNANETALQDVSMKQEE